MRPAHSIPFDSLIPLFDSILPRNASTVPLEDAADLRTRVTNSSSSSSSKQTQRASHDGKQPHQAGGEAATG